MKLYEILLRRVGLIQDKPVPQEKAEEEKIYNPIGCKVGGVVKIDSIDFRDHRFTVKEIQEYSVGIGGSTHRMVDYVLLSRPIGKPDFMVRLRVVPNDDKSRITHRAVVIVMDDEFEWNEDFLAVVNDPSKKFVVDDDKSDDDPSNDTHEEFWRVNDVGSSYNAKVKVLADTDGDGKVEAKEIVKAQVEFWDFSRMTEMDGVELEEFIFVEMNKDNGWFQIWRGTEVIPERIEVF